MTEQVENCDLLKAHHLCLALNNIMVLINSTLESEEIMMRVVVESAKAIGCESARIALREEEHWVSRYQYNLPKDMKDLSYSDEELPHASLAMITKKAVPIDDAFNDNRTNIDVMKSLGIRSVLVLPLIEKQKVVGALFFKKKRSRGEPEEINGAVEQV